MWNRFCTGPSYCSPELTAAAQDLYKIDPFSTRHERERERLMGSILLENFYSANDSWEKVALIFSVVQPRQGARALVNKPSLTLLKATLIKFTGSPKTKIKIHESRRDLVGNRRGVSGSRRGQ